MPRPLLLIRLLTVRPRLRSLVYHDYCYYYHYGHDYGCDDYCLYCIITRATTTISAIIVTETTTILIIIRTTTATTTTTGIIAATPIA
eukprot:6433796-Pyramimonas_sp.AAC.2